MLFDDSLDNGRAVTKETHTQVTFVYYSMTPGHSKDIQCHVWPESFLCLQITKSDIRPHVRGPGDCKESLDLPQGFVWVCMGEHPHFTT